MQGRERTGSAFDVRALRAAARGAARGGGRGSGRRHARSGRVAGLLRVAVPAALLAAALGAAVLAGIRWAEATAPPSGAPWGAAPAPMGGTVPITPIPVPAQGQADQMLRRAVRADADWADVIRGLDQRRASVFGRGDAAGLRAVYLHGSPALREDTADLNQLAAAELRTRGLRLVVSSVTVREAAPGRVSLKVVDRMPAYDVVDAAGRVVRQVPGRGDRPWIVTLVPATDAVGEWRIAAIAAAS
jgi:eukaryotic-like serine/threonine-protein kinase